MDNYLFLVDRSYCCVGPGLSCLPILQKNNNISKHFCVRILYFIDKKKIITPSSNYKLFLSRRWSFGVLLWEIETGGEFFNLAVL